MLLQWLGRVTAWRPTYPEDDPVLAVRELLRSPPVQQGRSLDPGRSRRSSPSLHFCYYRARRSGDRKK